MYHIIMAGGIGSRFWPMSTNQKPKQFLKLINDKSLIALTYERLLKISSPENIIIVTSREYKDLIREHIPNVLEKNILYEPSPMNTCPAIYLSSKFIMEKNDNAIMGIYPSDHYIGKVDIFYDSINTIEKFINKNNDAIVTLGMEPTFPSTSYGYINIQNNSKDGISKINTFIEKPNIDKAEKLIKNVDNLWNSGMFFSKARTMIEEIDYYIPEFKTIYKTINSLKDINKIWDKMPKESIDYAIMEKTDKSYCLKKSFDWSDLGTWQALYELLDKDKNNNVTKGKVVSYNSSNNLVIGHEKLTAVVGLDNIAIINLHDKTLVVDITNSEDVRYIIQEIKKNNL